MWKITDMAQYKPLNIFLEELRYWQIIEDLFVYHIGGNISWCTNIGIDEYLKSFGRGYTANSNV